MFKGKKVIITGGGRGIGKAIAGAFAREGADVLLVSRSSSELGEAQKELEKYGALVEILAADVSKPEGVEKISGILVKRFGTVDVLVNAAGIYGPIGRIEETAVDKWVETFSVNIFGTMMVCRTVIPFMKRRGRGSIINFVGGGDGGFPRFTAYASSKGAVARFTESLAEEVKEDGITVNAIAPGAVNTSLLQEVLSAGPERAGREFYEKSLKQKDGGGVSPERAAALALFLASDKAMGVTGRILSAVWDNWKEIPKHLDEIIKSDIYTLRRIKPEDRGYNW